VQGAADGGRAAHGEGAAETSVELERVASDELLGVVADGSGTGSFRWRRSGGASIELKRVDSRELLGVVAVGGGADRWRSSCVRFTW
jgi:hypothetical protein